MVFFTMWLQLLGFSDLTASTLMAIFAAGCALGTFAGGVIGNIMKTLHVDLYLVKASVAGAQLSMFLTCNVANNNIPCVV